MHSARIDRSARLQRVLRLLADGRPHSTLDIIQAAQVCAVNSIVAELRDNGIRVGCCRVGRIYYYQLGGRRIGEAA